jgi:hypothetical protein
MKATKAYIAGLGTTAVLIGSFLLLLVVGSTLVAFDGWPGVAADEGLDRVVVERDSKRPAAPRAKPATGERARAPAGRVTGAAPSRPAAVAEKACGGVVPAPPGDLGTAGLPRAEPGRSRARLPTAAPQAAVVVATAEAAAACRSSRSRPPMSATP